MLFCHHLNFKAVRLTDTKKLNIQCVAGVDIYNVCTKCGRVHKTINVSGPQLEFYDWGNIHLFVENENMVIGMVNTDIKKLISKRGKYGRN